MNTYALRDIKDGEEILIDYTEFAIADGWSKFGLG
jgi:SET domain-containing protein